MQTQFDKFFKLFFRPAPAQRLPLGCADPCPFTTPRPRPAGPALPPLAAPGQGCALPIPPAPWLPPVPGRDPPKKPKPPFARQASRLHRPETKKAPISRAFHCFALLMPAGPPNRFRGLARHSPRSCTEQPVPRHGRVYKSYRKTLCPASSG